MPRGQDGLNILRKTTDDSICGERNWIRQRQFPSVWRRQYEVRTRSMYFYTELSTQTLGDLVNHQPLQESISSVSYQRNI